MTSKARKELNYNVLTNSDAVSYQKGNAYSGADIKAIMYLPLYTRDDSAQKFKVFADLQTMSVSRTRSVSPVRVLGRSDPLTYTRGARTIAGTMVFATINKDTFNDVNSIAVAESMMSVGNNFVADQLPPFSVVIMAANEYGGVAVQVIHGITLTNYGTTYSVNDLYTETTYTYVATQMSPLTTDPNYIRERVADRMAFVDGMRSISSSLNDSLRAAYTSSTKSITDTLSKYYGSPQAQRAKELDMRARITRNGYDADPIVP